MKLDVMTTDGTVAGQVEVDDGVFAAEVREHLFWEVVKMQQANRRAGTHSTKTVSEVRGTGAKPYKQKGTGRARHGSNRAMNMRGGGVVFGPRPRSYAYKLPKKMVRGAMRSALSLRASQGALSVVRGWSPDAPKTSAAKAVLSRVGEGRYLVVGAADNDTLRLSVRNLPNAKFIPVEGVNLYDVLYHERLVVAEEVLDALQARYRGAQEKASA